MKCIWLQPTKSETITSLLMFTGKGVFRRGPVGAGVWVPIRDLHAGLYPLPSGPVEGREAAGRGGGGGWSGGRSDRVQKHKKRGDHNRTGSKSGSVSPPSQKTQRVVRLMDSGCFAIHDVSQTLHRFGHFSGSDGKCLFPVCLFSQCCHHRSGPECLNFP